MATKRHQHKQEPIVGKFSIPERPLVGGGDFAAECAELGASDKTYFRWCNQRCGLSTEVTKRIKELKQRNATLTRLAPEVEVEKVVRGVLAKGDS